MISDPLSLQHILVREQELFDVPDDILGYVFTRRTQVPTHAHISLSSGNLMAFGPGLIATSGSCLFPLTGLHI